MILFFSTFLISCQNDQECEQRPCIPPNINYTIELTLNFQNSQVGELIKLIRINKSDKSTIDTIQFELPASKEIAIGSGGTVGFTQLTVGDIFEEATLDFKVLYLNESINSISDIEIQAIQSECGCADYEISTLQLDEVTVEVNSKNFTLNL